MMIMMWTVCAFYLRAFYGLFYDRDKFHQLILLFFRDNKIYIYFPCFAAVVTDNDDDEKKLSDRVKIPDR